MEWNGSDITVTVKLHDGEDFQDLETYKYFYLGQIMRMLSS